MTNKQKHKETFFFCPKCKERHESNRFDCISGMCDPCTKTAANNAMFGELIIRPKTFAALMFNLTLERRYLNHGR
jgi:hypothetical protein